MYIRHGKKFSFLGLLVRLSVSFAIQAGMLASTARADVLSAIAKCESGGRQFTARGKLLRNLQSPDHIGMFQISIRVHDKAAKRHNLDIRTTAGNRKYAEILYGKYGTLPWLASKHCWKYAVLKKVTKIKVATN